MSPDLINAIFEFGGGCLIWLSVRQLFKDKKLKGVHWAPIIFFWLWGVWNLYFYPSLDQWWSLAGGVWIMVANGVWMGQIMWYKWIQPGITSAAASGRDDVNPTALICRHGDAYSAPYCPTCYPEDNT